MRNLTLNMPFMQNNTPLNFKKNPIYVLRGGKVINYSVNVHFKNYYFLLKYSYDFYSEPQHLKQCMESQINLYYVQNGSVEDNVVSFNM